MSSSTHSPVIKFPGPAAGAPVQKYPDDMMIIPFEHYMKDPGLRQDVSELMSGDMFRSSCARSKLGKKGYSDVFLEKMQNTGWRWKHMQPPHGLQFGLEPADDEIVSMCPAAQLPSQGAPAGMQSNMYSMAPRPSQLGETPSWVPLASLGLSIINTGSKLVLEIKNPEMLKHTLRQAQFAKSIYGKRTVWRMKMNGGRPIVEPNTIKIAKLSRELKTLKAVRIVGKASVIAASTISFIGAVDKNNAKGWSKFGLDMVMTGVAFIPPFGWVVSGIYFIADAMLDVCGIDWWSVFYDRLMAPGRTPEDIAMLEALTLALH